MPQSRQRPLMRLVVVAMVAVVAAVLALVVVMVAVAAAVLSLVMMAMVAVAAAMLALVVMTMVVVMVVTVSEQGRRANRMAGDASVSMPAREFQRVHNTVSTAVDQVLGKLSRDVR